MDCIAENIGCSTTHRQNITSWKNFFASDLQFGHSLKNQKVQNSFCNRNHKTNDLAWSTGKRGKNHCSILVYLCRTSAKRWKSWGMAGHAATRPDYSFACMHLRAEFFLHTQRPTVRLHTRQQNLRLGAAATSVQERKQKRRFVRGRRRHEWWSSKCMMITPALHMPPTNL